MIELRDIHFNYGKQVVLDIPWLVFEEGQRYCLIGENGSGKTTLIRILAGTLKPDRGSVTGIEHKRVGYMPQAPYAFSFSVLKNVKMALNSAENADEIATRALQLVGLESFREARGDQLSGGEAQRMGLARIIAVSHDLLLLDEPTSSTDIRGMDQIESVLNEYVAEQRSTLIFSTHSPAQVMRMADHVVFLEKGCLVESGTAEEVLRRPQSAATRAFLQHWRL